MLTIERIKYLFIAKKFSKILETIFLTSIFRLFFGFGESKTFLGRSVFLTNAFVPNKLKKKY